jgi:hypothetical protein
MGIYSINKIANFTAFPRQSMTIQEFTLWKDISSVKRRMIGLSFKNNIIHYAYGTGSFLTNVVKYNLDDGTYLKYNVYWETLWPDFFSEDNERYYFSTYQDATGPYVHIANKSNNIVKTYSVTYHTSIYKQGTVDSSNYAFFSRAHGDYSGKIAIYNKSTDTVSEVNIVTDHSDYIRNFFDQFNGIGILSFSNYYSNQTTSYIYQIDTNNLTASQWKVLNGNAGIGNNIRFGFGKLFIYNGANQMDVYDFNSKNLITSINTTGYYWTNNKKATFDTDTESKYIVLGQSNAPRIMLVDMKTLNVYYLDFSYIIPYTSYPYDSISYSYRKNTLLIFFDITSSENASDIKCWLISNMEVE